MSGPGDGAPARLRRLALGLVLAAGVMTPAAVAEAQRAGGTSAAPVTTVRSDDGTTTPINTGRRGFSLLANPEDLAFTGMHMSGGYGFFFPNNGPCPYYFNGPGATQNKHCGNTADRNGTFQQEFFEMSHIAGAPISDFRKIRSVFPGVNNMIGSFGYTAPYTFFLATPRAERWGASDGQFGNLFSGVQSTSGDGSCLDNATARNGNLDAKVNLLAGSDCPATWSRNGFQGPRPVLDAERQRAFLASPNTFHFNDWQLPASAFDSTTFLGSFSTYGAFTDAFREQIAAYGGITKLASGTPTIAGFPLGLDVRFDAFQFARPSLQNVVFWRLRMVNNSARLYGTGVDFDSLYYALEPGFLAAGTQALSGYSDFSRNAMLFSPGNDSRKCSATFPRRVPGVINSGCPAGDVALPTQPYYSIMVLKSPIGDAKNRLLTQTGSPYFNPASPFADDTITFQHVHRNGFGANYSNTIGFSDRSRFGAISSTEENFMDGRPNTAFTAAQTWQLFQNENFDGTNNAVQQRFQRMVPGSVAGYGKWDYNNDGIQDTLFVPTCGSRGCVRPFADTLPNGMQEILGNVGNILGTGPFKLKSGDTTEFLYAFIGAPDSTGIESYTTNALRAYLANFVGPSFYPVPTFNASDVSITNASVRDSTLARQDVQVRIRIRQLPVVDDPYLRSVIATLNDPNNVGVKRILALNPGLVARVQQRLRTNFDSLLVYKSCDNGRTFIVRNNDCTTSLAANPNGAPILSLAVDTLTGLLKTTQFTDLVAAGRTYLYSFVTKSRGLGSISIVDSIGFAGGKTLYGPSTLGNAAIQADTNAIYSPLARSGPTTVTVYAPISAPAGTVYGTLDTVRVSGNSTQRLTGTTRTTLVPGTYTATAANRFVIQQDVDTVRGTTTTTVLAQRLIGKARTAAGKDTSGFVASQDVFVSTAPTTTLTVDLGNNPLTTFSPTRRSASGSVVTYIDTLTSVSATGYILARQNVVGTNAAEPFFIALNTASVTTATFENSSAFPGFFVTPLQEAIPRTRATYRAPGDSISAAVVDANGVTLQNSASALVGVGGRYEVRWQGDAYGPSAPFLLSPAATLQPQVQASLAARPVGTTGSVDAATEALVRATAGASTSRPLIAAKFPFQIFSRDSQAVTLAMFRRNASSTDSVLANSILLGTLGDTVRISIPPDVWVPGDSIYVIERTPHDSTVIVNRAGSTTAKDTLTVLATQTINGRSVQAPVQSRAPFVGAKFVLGCLAANAVPSRLSCNPLVQTTRGATGYLTYSQGYLTVLDFARPLDLYTQYTITASAQSAANRRLTTTEGDRVLVVPNPYIVAAASDAVDAARSITSRIYFTHVPVQGTVRIYTVSGQLVQQLDYTASDLVAGTAQVLTGDLPYNLRSREGLDLSSGLYIFVLTPKGSASGTKPIRGKFVIIR